KYGSRALNHEARITTLDALKSDIDKGKYHWDELIFIRPTSDQKEFAGEVIAAKSISEWIGRLQVDIDLSDLVDLPVVVNKYKYIEREWRTFIVNGKVSSGSQYKNAGRLDIKCKLPKRVIEFAEQQSKIYSPSSVFVMDIAQNNEE